MTTEERLARIEEQLLGMGTQLASVLLNQVKLSERVEGLMLADARKDGARESLVASGRLVAGMAGGLVGGGLVKLLPLMEQMFGK